MNYIACKCAKVARRIVHFSLLFVAHVRVEQYNSIYLYANYNAKFRLLDDLEYMVRR